MKERTLKTLADFQQFLLEVSVSMVRLKKPDRLLRLITRSIDKQMGVTHTSFMVYDEDRKRFTFIDSKGEKKIPTQLVRFDLDHPIISWFSHGKKTKKDYVSRSKLPHAKKIKASSKAVLSEKIASSMDMLGVELAVPAFYKKSLIGVLLMGARKKGDSFNRAEINFFQTLVQNCSMAIKMAEYHRHLEDKNKQLEHNLKEIEHLRERDRNSFYEILRSLAQEVYIKDAYTYGHVKQVERLGLMVAQEMKLDLSGKKKDILSAGLILHDIGKIGIPDHILNKPARLDPEEWKIMQTHVENGARILEHMSGFQEVAKIVQCHHERWDGSGYPRGIKGEKIPLQARIVTVVDAFHAIVSTRCYSKGRPIEVAFQELKKCAGSQFDPQVVDALIRAVQKEMRKKGANYLVDRDHKIVPPPEVSRFPGKKYCQNSLPQAIKVGIMTGHFRRRGFI